MTQLDRQIRKAQHRLWIDRTLRLMTLVGGFAAAAFAAVVLVQRLYDLPIPLLWIGIGLCAVAIVVTGAWTAMTREDAEAAAARLDQAAGLKERVSSGRFCQGSGDPFATAVVADAEQIAGSIAVRQHLRLGLPRSLAASCGFIVLAAVMFAVPVGWLKPEVVVASEQKVVETQQTKVAVKKKMDSLRKLMETSPALDELKDKLSGMDEMSGGRLRRADSIRHEAVKKIDKLADAVKQKRRSGKYDKVGETRKVLRRLKSPKSSEAPTQKLTKALAKGDFKTAKEEVNKLKEQLATLKMDKDKELTEELSKRLAELAKQLEKISEDKKLAQQLEQAGIKKEDVERMLENLSKKDIDQVKKQLAEKGLGQKQIEKLAKQLKKKQQAGSTSKKLANSMKQGAKCNNPGQMGEAIAGLSQAADQLSELESLEQEMNQLDSAMSALNDAKDDIDKPCSQCKGTGQAGGKKCGKCNGSGGQQGKVGMGRNMGKGRGGLAPEQQTNVGFKTERAKVHTGQGATIGQFEFDGEQVKGKVGTGIAEVVTAAEREATDRINRDRVPRQYQKAVREYFSNVQKSIKESKQGEADGKSSGDSGATGADQSSAGDGEASSEPAKDQPSGSDGE